MPPHSRRAVGGQVQPDGGHPVLFGVVHDLAFRVRDLMPFGRILVIEAGHRPAHRCAELARGLGLGPPQHPGLHLAGHNAMFGPHLTNEINWQGHDPATLMSNLRGMDLSLYTASGIPGALDGLMPDLGASAIELLTHVSTISFAERARAYGVPYHLDDYVSGTHTFADWARDLREFVPRLMTVFAHPSPEPSSVSYRSVAARWTQWGWTVTNHRTTAQAWSALEGAPAAGFTLSGRGATDVTTPPDYAPDSTHRVRITGPAGTRASIVTADPRGRLDIHVPMTGTATATATATATVAIS